MTPMSGRKKTATKAHDISVMAMDVTDRRREVDFGHHAHGTLDQVGRQFLVVAGTLLTNGPRSRLQMRCHAVKSIQSPYLMSTPHFNPSTRAMISFGRT